MELHFAIHTGNIELVKSLLNQGTHIDIKDSSGMTPLHLAVYKGAVEFTQLLLDNKADVHTKDHENKTALFLAIERGFPDIVSLLLEYGECANSALLHAARHGREEIISRLLESHNADVDSKDEVGVTALHIAAANGNLGIAEYLLKHGACVGAIVNDGNWINREPLHCAAINGNEKIVRLILNYGGKIDSLCGIKEPLVFAVESSREEAVDVLLEFGADINMSDKGHDNSMIEHGFQSTLFQILVIDATYYYHTAPSWRLDMQPVVGKFIKHIVIMKAQNLYVSANNLESLMDYDDVSNFRLSCENEIASMKVEEIITNICFFDMFTMSKKKLAECIENGSVAQVLENSYYKTEFPIYASLIERQFNKGCELLKMQSANIGSSNVFFFYILTENKNKLAGHLRNKNVVHVLELQDYKKDFPLHASLINQQFTMGKERKKLLYYSSNILYDVLKDFGIQYHVVEKIVCYLTNSDLTHMTQELEGHAEIELFTKASNDISLGLLLLF